MTSPTEAAVTATWSAVASSAFSAKGVGVHSGAEGVDLMNGGGTPTVVKVPLSGTKGADNAGVTWNGGRSVWRGRSRV